MPLDCSRLDESTVDAIKAIPLDTDSLSHCDYTYQTKVDIYDKKCGGGCGFCRIEVDCLDHIEIFNNSQEAISFCARSGYRMERLCEYPNDIYTIHNQIHYPNVTEIVLNTCRFWYDMLIDENEAEFVEEVNVDKIVRDSGECCIAQIVSQPYPSRQTS